LIRTQLIIRRSKAAQFSVFSIQCSVFRVFSNHFALLLTTEILIYQYFYQHSYTQIIHCPFLNTEY
jgi:hypothetical protein